MRCSGCDAGRSGPLMPGREAWAMGRRKGPCRRGSGGPVSARRLRCRLGGSRLQHAQRGGRIACGKRPQRRSVPCRADVYRIKKACLQCFSWKHASQAHCYAQKALENRCWLVFLRPKMDTAEVGIGTPKNTWRICFPPLLLATAALPQLEPLRLCHRIAATKHRTRGDK